MMIGKIAFGVGVALILLAVLAGVLLLGAVAIYVYPGFPLLMQALAVIEAPCLFALLVSPLMLLSDVGDKIGTFFAYVAMGVLIWLLNSFILFLGDAWDVDLAGWVGTIIRAPKTGIEQVTRFFDALLTALTGQSFELQLPKAEPKVPLSHIAKVDVGPVLSWLLDSAWAIVLGVISAIPAARLIGNRR